jgi:hypothetical protein
MARTLSDLQQELNITNETSLSDLVDALQEVEVISQAEINNIKAISVLPLPNNVKDKAEELKQRFTDIVLNENKGIIYLLNVRTILLSQIVTKIAEGVDPYNKNTLKSIVQEIMEELYPDVSEEAM